MVDFSDRLKKGRKVWKTAKKEVGASNFDNLPNGTYKAWLTGEVKEAQSSGNLGFSFKYAVEGGDCHGKNQYIWRSIERHGEIDPDFLKWLGGTLKELGYDPGDYEPEDLPNIAQEISAANGGKGLFVRFTGKASGDFFNANRHEILDPDEEGVASKGSSNNDDDDDDDDDEYTVDEINEMSKDDLFELIDDEELDVKKKGKLSKIKEEVIAALELENDEEEEEDDEEEDDDGEEEEDFVASVGDNVWFKWTKNLKGNGKNVSGTVKAIKNDKASVSIDECPDDEDAVGKIAKKIPVDQLNPADEVPF